MDLELERVKVEKEEEMNVILGQSHFIKTVEDIYEALVTSVPEIKFGLAFCEASGDKLVRYDGTDEELKELAVKNMRDINAGHSFMIILKGSFPINVMKAVKDVPEVCRIFCATANPVEVIVADAESGRGILGVIDGEPTVGVEGEEDKKKRKEFLENIGYKR
ncbi:MAG: adenosine-specific kinase [Candidatus Aenigmatarchaeota archaeon]